MPASFVTLQYFFYPGLDQNALNYVTSTSNTLLASEVSQFACCILFGCVGRIHIDSSLARQLLFRCKLIIEDMHELRPPCGQKVGGERCAEPQYVNIGKCTPRALVRRRRSLHTVSGPLNG